MEEAYEKDGLRDAFWDQIALLYHWGEYKLGIRTLMPGDICELDTLEELCQEDPSYHQ